MKVAAISLALGALVYASVLTEAVLGYPLSPTLSYLSELSALDQPSSTLVRTMDAVAGAIFLAVGIYLWVAWRAAGLLGHPRESLTSGRYSLLAAGLILAGGATVLDALFPMDCAESLTSCRAQLATGASFSHLAHTVTSSLAGLGLVVVAVGAFLLGKRILQVVSAIVVAAMAVQLVTITAVLPVGIAQRVQVTASVVVMVMLAWQIGGGHVGDSSGSRARAA